MSKTMQDLFPLFRPLKDIVDSINKDIVKLLGDLTEAQLSGQLNKDLNTRIKIIHTTPFSELWHSLKLSGDLSKEEVYKLAWKNVMGRRGFHEASVISVTEMLKNERMNIDEDKLTFRKKRITWHTLQTVSIMVEYADKFHRMKRAMRMATLSESTKKALVQRLDELACQCFVK